MAVVGQYGASFQIVWTSTGNPVRFQRSSESPSLVLADQLPASQTYFIEVVPTAQTGDTLEWTVVDLVTSNLDIATYEVVDDSVPYTYGDVNWLETDPRYASLNAVKKRLQITDTSWDAEITQAIVSAEVAMDVYWGRSLPDTGLNPEIPGIPSQVTQAAENIAVAVLKQTDAPFGVAGSDEYLGELDIDDAVRRELNRSPLLRGMRRGWGLS